MKRYLPIVCIAVILCIGIYARFADLADHFTHVDDIGVAKSILDAKHYDRYGLLAVPYRWTYAPAQFLITPLFINLEQNYRDVLFWGRLPSFLFSVMALVLFFVFYRRYKPNEWQAWLLPLTLLAVSLETVILAKQMHNYSMGLLGVVILLLLLLDVLQRKSFSISYSFFIGLMMAVLVNMNYFLLFFVPAFMVIFGYKIIMFKDESKVALINRFVFAGVVFLGFLYPTWVSFLSENLKAGNTTWNLGVNHEFIFQWQGLAGAFIFFAKNSFLVFDAMTAFLPEHVTWKIWISAGLYLLAIFGIIRLWISTDGKKKSLAVFITIVLITWIWLVITQKLMLSPTRHQIGLLPLMILLVGEGIDGALSFISNRLKINQAAINIIFSSLILISFLFHFGDFRKERRDPFNEEEILKLIKQYKVQAVMTGVWVNQIDLMKSVRDYYNYYDVSIKNFSIICGENCSYDTVAWISQRSAISPLDFEISRVAINDYIKVMNFFRQKKGQPLRPLMDASVGRYSMIYKKELPSAVESEYSRRTRNGSNGYYVYVFKKVQP